MVAVAGTVTVIEVLLDETTVASTPLNLTVMKDEVPVKPVPEMVTVPPSATDVGVNEVSVGAVTMVNAVPAVVAP